MNKLSKANPEIRQASEPWMRVFECCPDCGHYLSPGFRTDMCVFCHADFTKTEEYKEAVEREALIRATLSQRPQLFYGAQTF